MASIDAAWQTELARALQRATSALRFALAGASAWADAWRVDADDGATFFVKVARARFRSMTAAEADGLRALAYTGCVRVPVVVATVAHAEGDALVLEWADLQGLPDAATLGRALAALHRAPAPRGPHGERFGWPRDNWIGGTPQRNAWHDDWAAFFRDARLVPQLELAARNGYAHAIGRDAERIADAVPALLHGHDPVPAMLHGDLWPGNVGGLRDGTPLLFDPAVYVGDREADLAMTELFGGFAPAFHAAYREVFPVAPGYAARRTLYNLYHVLNHVNLFGEDYLARARRDIATLLAHVR